jgi:hypothetical protein
MSVLQKTVIGALVAIHLAANVWHGGAHRELVIDPSSSQLAFIVVVILMAPVVSGVLVWTRFVTPGLWMLLLSMLGALLFGVYHHYILISPDNIAHLPDGSHEAHERFASSAATLAVLELAGAVYGAFCLGARGAR